MRRSRCDCGLPGHRLYDNVDVEAELSKLPPPVDRLAGPISAACALRGRRSREPRLARPEVQTLWEEANRTAHERMLAVIDDEAQAVTEDEGAVYLDLTVISSDYRGARNR